jgi:tetratricopeptide (TPR) repeat protein
MSFVRKLFGGLKAEFHAIYDVVPLLHRPFWVVWTLLFPLSFVGLLPSRWAVVAQLLVLGGIGLGVLLFAGKMAKMVRRRHWVEFPEGREVAPFLPQLITLLAGPPYMLAMLVLFRRAPAEFPGILPTSGWADALLLALDNFLRTQIFFDAAECFHFRLHDQVDGAGTSLVFVSRFLMDLVFVKLAVQLFNAAYYRALGMGRGEDKLFAIKQEVEAGDAAKVKYLTQSVRDSLRDAVDKLRSYHEDEAGAESDRREMAWKCLVSMKEYALHYLKDRERAAAGDERHRLAKLMDRLAEARPEETVDTEPVRRWPLVALAATLGISLLLSLILPVSYVLPLSALVTIVLSWMLVDSRGWIDRLVGWGALNPSTPDRLPRVQLFWALCVLPPLLLSWSRLFELAALLLWPTMFSGADGTVNFGSTLVFGLENLAHTQIFADTFEVYGIVIADIRQEGVAGGVLTFLLRLVLNVGIIELIVGFGMVWFNRVFRKFAVSPNAELSLRQEAHACGAQSATMIGFYLREIRGFLMEEMKRQKDETMLVSLYESGFYRESQGKEGNIEENFDVALSRIDLGQALRRKGLLEEAAVELRAALQILKRLTADGCDTTRYAALGVTHTSLGHVLHDQGSLEAALAEYASARAIFERLNMREEIARTQNQTGLALNQQGRLNEAITEHEGAGEIFAGLVREGQANLRVELASTWSNLGFALNKQGNYEQAVTKFVSAKEILEEMVSEGGNDLRAQLAGTLAGLGDVRRSQGRHEEAVSAWQAAREHIRQLMRAGRDEFRVALANAQYSLYAIRIDQGRRKEAFAELEPAQEITEQLVREGRNDLRYNLALMRNALANVTSYLAKHAEPNSHEKRKWNERTIVEYKAACEIIERLVREGRDDLRDELARIRACLGTELADQGRFEEGAAEIQSACDAEEALVREGRSDVWQGLARTRLILGVVRKQQGRLEDAVIEYQAALSIQERLVNEGRDDVRCELAATQNCLGEMLRVVGRGAEAIAHLAAGKQILEDLVRAGRADLLWQLVVCWKEMLAVPALNQQDAAALVDASCSWLRELLPRRAELSFDTVNAIVHFLRSAQELNVCADEVAELLTVFSQLRPSL